MQRTQFRMQFWGSLSWSRLGCHRPSFSFQLCSSNNEPLQETEPAKKPSIFFLRCFWVGLLLWGGGFSGIFSPGIIFWMLQNPCHHARHRCRDTNSVWHGIAYQGCDQQLAKNGDILGWPCYQKKVTSL